MVKNIALLGLTIKVSLTTMVRERLPSGLKVTSIRQTCPQS